MTRTRNATGWAACALMAAASGLGAQVFSLGRLEGTITERGQSRALRSASVEAVRLDPAPTVSFTATPDERGRFHLDSIPAGLYMVQLASARLDSLQLSMPASQLRVEPGRTSHADFALPQGAAIRDAVCFGVLLTKGRGVVAGRVVDADTEQPLANAEVVVAWNEITVDNATLKSTTQERSGVVRTGPRGEYRLCGVPTGSWLSIQLQHANRSGGIARVSVSDEEGAVARDLSLSVQTAPLLSTLDSLERAARIDAGKAAADSVVAGHLTGTASVTGVVRGAAGEPVADAEIRVLNARAITTTDASGRFTLDGLPAGTQLLSVRRIGYGNAERDVELRSGTSIVRNVSLVRAISLDSIRIIATRSRYPEFDANRKSNLFGKFLTREEIRERHPEQISELITQLGGFTILESGVQAKVISGLAKAQHPGCEESNVVIDGMQKAGVNYLPPSEVVGIEIYRDGTTAPPAYRSACGVIVLWTRKYHPSH